MSTVLILNSSATGAASVSRQVDGQAVANLRAQDPRLRVVTRDLGTDPIPHLTLESATALRGADPVNREQAAAQALSNERISELKAADVIVIGAPMYNFGIPSTLKAWFGYVLRAGFIFRYQTAV